MQEILLKLLIVSEISADKARPDAQIPVGRGDPLTLAYKPHWLVHMGKYECRLKAAAPPLAAYDGPGLNGYGNAHPA